tara:strand:- start:137 stop:277 length:141 start_codon:yes stop_codon:yes gene_type:complete
MKSPYKLGPKTLGTTIVIIELTNTEKRLDINLNENLLDNESFIKIH